VRETDLCPSQLMYTLQDLTNKRLPGLSPRGVDPSAPVQCVCMCVCVCVCVCVRERERERERESVCVCV
jgi:hypothetical protein